jgi:nucleoside-diphosphate-sugar epimerase
MSNAFVQVLRTETEKVNGQIFNVGTNDDNYKVKEIAQLVEEIVPNSKIEYATNADKDSRSYKVNFDKIREQIGYKTKWKLKDGIRNIYEELKKRGLEEKDFNDEKFYRVKYLKSLMAKGLLDEKLRV